MRLVNESTEALTDEDLADLEGRDSRGDHTLEAIPNRRAFEAEATRHVSFARRNKHPLCFAVIAFDRVAPGDAEETFLREATARWHDVLRTEDLLGRWGDNQLAMLLPNCTTVSAVQLCWRLREATPNGHSFSAGLASYQGSETVEELVDRANDCLVQAKAKGRDRTVAEGLVDLD